MLNCRIRRQVQSLLRAVVTARSAKLPVAPPRAHH